jgi:hypothetical protein
MERLTSEAIQINEKALEVALKNTAMIYCSQTFREMPVLYPKTLKAYCSHLFLLQRGAGDQTLDLESATPPAQLLTFLIRIGQSFLMNL